MGFQHPRELSPSPPFPCKKSRRQAVTRDIRDDSSEEDNKEENEEKYD